MNNMYSKEKTLNKFFEEQVLKTPNKKAVEHEKDSITYDELNKKANQLARILKDKGVSTDDIIAVAVERSINMIIAILAILKSGGIYLPINIDYPKARNEIIISNSKAKLLLYSTINYCTDCHTECFDINDVPLNIDEANLNLNLSADNTACIIYTSGSTGLPKGAMLSHHSFINTLSWAVGECDISEQDNIFNKSSVNFDASTFEIFLHFFTGAKLCLCRQGQEGNADYLMREINDKQITVCVMVSSLLRVFIDYIEHKDYMDNLKSLKIVFSGGDRLSYSIVQKFNKLLYTKNHTRLYNLYGPAETTICCTYFDCTDYKNDSQIIPIGKPIANTNIYILDENMDICTENQVGEIYVSGKGVGKAYVNDNKLTRQRFLKDKFINGRIMYKTGDLGKWNSSGNIEFCGRIDNQIKIRGNRVELEEIESVMVQYYGVMQAAVFYIENSKTLIAFYTSKDTLLESEFKQFLLTKLPDYMIPTNLIHICDFPLNNTGKIDRKKLLDTYLSNVNLLASSAINEKKLENNKTIQIIKNNIDPTVANLLTLDKDMQSAGIDSLTFIKIIVEIETEYDIEYDNNMLSVEAFPSVDSFINYVESKVASKNMNK